MNFYSKYWETETFDLHLVDLCVGRVEGVFSWGVGMGIGHWAVFRISRVESCSPHQTMEAAQGVMYSILLLIFSNILQELN